MLNSRSALFLGCLFALLYAFPMSAQPGNVPKTTLFPVPAPSVSISSLSEHAVTAFAGLNIGSGLDPAFVIISNQSSEPIVAISARWTFVYSDGKERTFKQWCDTFLAGHKPVLLPNSYLLLGPNTSVVDSPVVATVENILRWEKGILPALSNLSEVRVKIDGILFEQGRFYGEATSYVADINARVAAAQTVAGIAKAGLANGQQPADIIVGLTTLASNYSTTDAEGKWVKRFIDSLSAQRPGYFQGLVTALDQIHLSAPIDVQPTGN